MDSGIISSVIVSQAFHIVWKSCKVGTPNAVEVGVGAFTNGNVNAGRSNNHNEYWPSLSTQRLTGLSSDAVSMVYASLSEY